MVFPHQGKSLSILSLINGIIRFFKCLETLIFQHFIFLDNEPWDWSIGDYQHVGNMLNICQTRYWWLHDPCIRMEKMCLVWTPLYTKFILIMIQSIIYIHANILYANPIIYVSDIFIFGYHYFLSILVAYIPKLVVGES